MAASRSGVGVAAFAALGALLGAVTLQGCGGATDSSTTHMPTTATTVTTITTTTTVVPTAVPPSAMSKLIPLRAISYRASPIKKIPPVLPGLDMMQIGYEMQWGPKGRDDLGQMKMLGATTVRLYNAIGLEYTTDHGAFLDRAQEIGMHVIVGMHSKNLCPGFDCYKTWKDSVVSSSKVGFVKNGAWHPAIAMVVIMDKPDILNFWETPGVPTNCSSSSLKGNEAQCRVKAALSAMDGFLAAETELGIDSTVNLTISWTFKIADSIDKKVIGGEGYYGFQDMVAGIANPKLAKYSPKGGSAGQKTLSDAFANRWVHSISAGAKWDYIKEKIESHYQPYAPKPWFLAEFTASDPSASIQGDLQAMDSAASAGGLFLGVSFADYQHDYVADTPQGIYALGKDQLENCNPCTEDVATKDKECRKFPVYCLDAAAGDGKRADAVAAAWAGTWKGHGMCVIKDNKPSQMEIVV